MKEFNTTGLCIPSKHYMVDLTERVQQIKKLIDAGKYFTINRGRQYGKTTTLNALRVGLGKSYYVVSMDFQDYGEQTFQNEETFCRDFASEFCALLSDAIDEGDPAAAEIDALIDLAEDMQKQIRFFTMFRSIKKIWAVTEKPIVLLIDEVDSASNNQVFMDFLAQLRSHYLKREANSDYKAFQSVILAGVSDVRHLKAKIRPEKEHKVNSPWNIAAEFDIDMSLAEEGIRGMLDEYEADYHTGMDTAEIAKQIHAYTNGYPFLVSRICQLIDTKLVPEVFQTLSEAWTAYGVDEAVKRILSEDNALFASLMGKLTNYPELKGQLKSILLQGEKVAWVADDEQQKLLYMYGFIQNNHNVVAIANRIFEMRLYHYFIGESNRNDDLKQRAAASRSIFIMEDGGLDVRKIMEHFIEEHNRIHKDQTQKFLEEEGRERFLTYLSPIINGTGTYSIEEQTRDHQRMDVVIHYLGRRYIIELKIWHGERYNADGEKQITEYLDYWKLDTGYMLSFNFNQKKTSGVARVQVGDKVLFEGTV